MPEVTVTFTDLNSGNEYNAEAPNNRFRLLPGRYSWRVLQEGYRMASSEIVVVPGRSKDLFIKLTPVERLHRLTVLVNENDVEVIVTDVNNKFFRQVQQGNASAPMIFELPPALYQVVARADGFKTIQNESAINLVSGDDERVQMNLVRLGGDFYMVGEAAYRNGRYQEAIDNLIMVDNASQDYFSSLILLGTIYRVFEGNEDLPKAIDYLNRAIQLDRSRYEPHINLSAIYIESRAI